MTSANVSLKGVVKQVAPVEGKTYMLVQVETVSQKGFGDFSTVRDFSGTSRKAGDVVDLPCLAKAYKTERGAIGLSLDHYGKNGTKK